ncbi:MAG: ABC transporter ATP-binding protein [Gammaproteobacteria bacterium]|nr:ABC transporter ATP-binding protein [Gammaproteobacteria bacterium]|tara:strand:+ start:432 stop:1169 length:738 start_codon:yes stop_codon:yes gene_type:complete
MIAIQDVSKVYGQTTVLAGISLTVPAATTLSLIGPSGCGKSTLLRIVMGLLTADQGQVSIDNEVVTPQNRLALRRRMGYVIQSGGLFPHLTAHDNLTLVTRFLGWRADQENTRIDALCDLTGIDPSLLTRRPGKLSGGQAQRISLMRALMLDPPVLLMDEPLGAIDPLVRYELQNDLRSIFRKLGKTVLLVTHDLGEAAFLGDRIALMQEGRVIQDGPARELMRSPATAFVEQFVTAQRSPLQDL